MLRRMSEIRDTDAGKSATSVPDPGSEGRWFGFKPVDPREKAGLVRQVFDSVAERYDLMNDLMSGGVHRLWKAALIEMIRPRPGMVLLDVAGGTGDIAFRFLDAGGSFVHVCDINESMLRVGRDRAINRGTLDGIDWITGDAMHLPIASRSVDAYTIAFGLRNVTGIDEALREAGVVDEEERWRMLVIAARLEVAPPPRYEDGAGGA